jgi:hypothetical protein
MIDFYGESLFLDICGSNLSDQVSCVLLGVGPLLDDAIEELAAGHSSRKKMKKFVTKM